MLQITNLNLYFFLTLECIKGKLKIDQAHEISMILLPEQSVPLERNLEILV